MIDSGSRSQVRPLESFKRSRFGLLAIASFIVHYPDKEPRRRRDHSGWASTWATVENPARNPQSH